MDQWPGTPASTPSQKWPGEPVKAGPVWPGKAAGVASAPAAQPAPPAAPQAGAGVQLPQMYSDLPTQQAARAGPAQDTFWTPAERFAENPEHPMYQRFITGLGASLGRQAGDILGVIPAMRQKAEDVARGRDAAMSDDTLRKSTDLAGLVTGGELTGLKTAAVKSGEQITEGISHPKIEAETGLKAPQEGFTDLKGNFKTRGEAANIAKQTGQAQPQTGAALHSEELKGGPNDQGPIPRNAEGRPIIPPQAKGWPGQKLPDWAEKPPTFDELEAEINNLLGKGNVVSFPSKEPALTAAFKPPAEPKPSGKEPHQMSADEYMNPANFERVHNPNKLSMEEDARIIRAQKQGFDTDLKLYHGTSKNYMRPMINEHSSEPGFFTTPDPEAASGYAGHVNAHVTPVVAKLGKAKTVDWKGELYSNFRMTREIKAAKAKGYDTLINKNMLDSHVNHPYDQYVHFKEENLRSRYGAVYDPAVMKNKETRKTAHMLSAAAAPKAEPLPEKPTKEFVSGQADAMHRVRTGAEADKSELTQAIKNVDPMLRKSEVQERVQRFEEGDQTALSPPERSAYQATQKPLKEDERQTFIAVKKLSPEMAEQLNPNYTNRRVIGKTPEFDPILGDDSDPIVGRRGLPQKTGSMFGRTYMAITAEDGTRKVIRLSDRGGATTWESNKPKGSIPPQFDKEGEEMPLVRGAQFEWGGKKWTVDDAKTAEIEQHTPTRYHKNALANTVLNLQRLRTVERSIDVLDKLRNSPEGAAYMRKTNQMIAGAREPKMPLFKGWKVEDELADAIDDFYGRDPTGWEAITKINRFLTQSLFWAPTKHALNTSQLWSMARGKDWATFSGWNSLIRDMPKAIYEVATQGPAYRSMLRNGSSLVYGSIANQGFYENVLKLAGEEMKKELKTIEMGKGKDGTWSMLAKNAGMPLKDFITAWYKGSSKALWAFTDVLMMQRVLELKRAGMNERQAIAEAERVIPNYRIPTTVAGSRAISKLLQEPNLSQFSRYHYGELKALSNMAGDLAKGGKDPIGRDRRLEAAGQILVLGLQAILFAPAIGAVLTASWNWGTGRNDKVTLGKTSGVLGKVGPMIGQAADKGYDKFLKQFMPDYANKVEKKLHDYYKDDDAIPDFFKNSITLSPLLDLGVNSLRGQNDFGQSVWQQGASVPRNLANVGENALSQAIEPYKMLSAPFREPSKHGHPNPWWKEPLSQTTGIEVTTGDRQADKEYWKTQDKKKANKAKPKGLIPSAERSIEKLF